MDIYIYELHKTTDITNLNLENVKITIQIKRFEGFDDYIDKVHYLVSQNQTKPILIQTIYNNSINKFLLITYHLDQLNMENINECYKNLTNQNYDIGELTIEDYLDIQKADNVIKIDQNHYLYKNYQIEGEIFTRDFNYDHKYNKLKASSKWFVSKDYNNRQHIVTIYADYSCDEDLALYEDQYEKEYEKVLENVFDFIEKNDHKFWQYYVHSNTSNRYSRFCKIHDLHL